MLAQMKLDRTLRVHLDLSMLSYKPGLRCWVAHCHKHWLLSQPPHQSVAIAYFLVLIVRCRLHRKKHE